MVILRPIPQIAIEAPTIATFEEGTEAKVAYRVTNRGNTTENLTFWFDTPATRSAAQFAYDVQPAGATLGPNETVEVTLRVLALPTGNGTRALGMFQVIDAAGGALLGTQPLALDATAPAAPAGETVLLRWLRENAGLVAGAGALAAAWLALRRESWRYAALTAAFPLYTRLARSEVLQQERRDHLHRLITDEPGINYSEIKRRTGLPSGVLVHHLRTLEKHGFIASRRDGALRRFAPTRAEMPAPAPPPVTPMQRRVLDLLERGPMTQRRIAETLGLTQQGANQHVKALERRGLLAIRYEEGEYRCHAIKPGFPIKG